MWFKRKEKIMGENIYQQVNTNQETHEEPDKRSAMNDQFIIALSIVDDVLKHKGLTKEEQIEILDFIMHTIKVDMQTEYIAKVFYETDVSSLAIKFLPDEYYDEAGNKHKLLISENETYKVNLKDDAVITFPWRYDRLINCANDILKCKFEYDETNHKSTYYKGLDLCRVYNGKHSTAIGIYKKEGYIDANVVDVIPMFEHVISDGVYFYNAHTNEQLCKVQDFRIAVLYEMGRIKYKLEKDRE